MYFGRIDGDDIARRQASLETEMVWRPSESAGPGNQIFAGAMYWSVSCAVLACSAHVLPRCVPRELEGPERPDRGRAASANVLILIRFSPATCPRRCHCHRHRGYSAPDNFCFDSRCTDEPLMDDPRLAGYNVDRRVEEYVSALLGQAATTQGGEIMVMAGDDFNYVRGFLSFPRDTAGAGKVGGRCRCGRVLTARSGLTEPLSCYL